MFRYLAGTPENIRCATANSEGVGQPSARSGQGFQCFQ